MEDEKDGGGGYLIAYQINEKMPVKNLVTTEHPFDFLRRINNAGHERVTLINFWELTADEYWKLSGVL